MKKSTIYWIGGSLLFGAGAYLVYTKYFSRGMTKKGMEFLNFLETGGKIYPKMILDTKNLPTIGIGHLIKPNEKHLLTATLTKKQIYDLFNKDLDWAEKAVSDTIKVPLKPYQKDALTSLTFNIGDAGFRKSSLAKAINRKAPQSEIIKEFAKWKYPLELKSRRAKEIRLYLTGNYSQVIAKPEVEKYFST
jgi:lysozyme